MGVAGRGRPALSGAAAGPAVVGEAGAQSNEAAFNSSRGVGAIYPYTLAAIADLGESSQAAMTVSQLVDGLDHIDAIAFNGDISYASGCERNGCATWDALQRVSTAPSLRVELADGEKQLNLTRRVTQTDDGAHHEDDADAGRDRQP